MSPINTLPDTTLAVQDALPSGAPARTADAEKARQTAQDFEAVFLSQMIEHMFTGIGTDGLFDGGHGEETFRSLMFDEFGKVLARAGGVGLADAVQREILKTQEVK
ncbi:MAG: rod-binding protein [Alphaproteobacteria bacterium]